MAIAEKNNQREGERERSRKRKKRKLKVSLRKESIIINDTISCAISNVIDSYAIVED